MADTRTRFAPACRAVTGPDGSTQPFRPLKDVALHALSDAYVFLETE